MHTPIRKTFFRATLILWILVLGCNGLIVAVAFYSELAASTVVQYANRPIVEKEFFVRDPRLGWRLQPHTTYDLLDGTTQERVPYFTTGADGLRTTREKKDSPSNPAIVLLGDSFVQGYYLYDHETIAARLEERTGLDVLNAGIGGYSTDQEFILLQQLLAAHDPSWVVLVAYSNDLPLLQSATAWKMQKPRFAAVNGLIDFSTIHPPPTTRSDSIALPAARREVVDCCTYGFFGSIGEKIAQTYAALPHPRAVFGELQSQIALSKKFEYTYEIENENFYTQPEQYRLEWNLFFQFLIWMRSQGDRENYRLLVLYLPEIGQIAASDRDHFAPQHYFLDDCGRINIDCIEPHRAFIERQQEIDLFFMDDGHLSPAGADLVAQILQDHIATR